MTCFKAIYIYIYITYSYFKSLTFFQTAILEPMRSISQKLLIKSRNQNIFQYLKWIGVSDKFRFQWYIVCWGQFSPSKLIGGKGGGAHYLHLQKGVITFAKCVCREKQQKGVHRDLKHTEVAAERRQSTGKFPFNYRVIDVKGRVNLLGLESFCFWTESCLLVAVFRPPRRFA